MTLNADALSLVANIRYSFEMVRLSKAHTYCGSAAHAALSGTETQMGLARGHAGNKGAHSLLQAYVGESLFAELLRFSLSVLWQAHLHATRLQSCFCGMQNCLVPRLPVE